MSDWDFKNATSWKDIKDVTCVGDLQSPINIDTTDLKESNFYDYQSAKFYFNYKPTKCHLIVKNRMPTIRFDYGSYIEVSSGLIDNKEGYKFDCNSKSLNKFYLKKMTLHTPSMHTINNNHYDMEAILYHQCSSEVSKDSEDLEGGIAISLLFKSGSDKGSANRFFSQIINQIIKPPETDIEKEVFIDVDDLWSPEWILPTNKAFFTYPGSLPYPPCNQKWFWVVFEESNMISKTLLETFKLGYNRTNRIVQELKDKRKIKYNNNPKFNKENKKYLEELKKIEHKIKNLNQKKKDINNKMHQHKDKLDTLFSKNKEKKQPEKDKKMLENEPEYKKNKKTIKMSLIAITFFIIIFASLKIASFFVLSGALPNFINKSSTSYDDNNNNNNNDDNNNED